MQVVENPLFPFQPGFLFLQEGERLLAARRLRQIGDDLDREQIGIVADDPPGFQIDQGRQPDMRPPFERRRLRPDIGAQAGDGSSEPSPLR
ncbi:hypothetical protein [Thermobacillus composti]|uniref:hypothetical protein n=1 Tax=Thermobacillus composti TaxID=377615 RepID=UPI0005A44DE0|nr:hypothetical protein [Thermobacillus composti]